MDRETELAVVRRAYAKQILAVFGVNSPSVEAAFGKVRREDFLGAGPWSIGRGHWGSLAPTPSDDPIYLYVDTVVAIDPTREINNGQPSLHAHLLAMAAPENGEHVVHVGTGTGYYTAIMAEIVGPCGRVTGIEFDPELAARTERNLSAYDNVEIICGDGASVSFDAADVIYVNAGATAPATAWLDRLKEGGRLILPLTTDKGFGKVEFDPEKFTRRGAVFRIKRVGDEYRAKWVSAVAIFPCAGNRDEASEAALASAFERGEMLRVQRLYRNPEMVSDDRCWLRGRDWCLAFD